MRVYLFLLVCSFTTVFSKRFLKQKPLVTCGKDGFHRVEGTCNKFYRCENGLNRGVQKCPPNTKFNEHLLVCDHDDNVDCDPNAIVKVTTLQSLERHTIVFTSTAPSNTVSATAITPMAIPMNGKNKNNYKVVCYFTNWAFYRPEDGKFLPEDIDTSYCTHINYAFATLHPTELTIQFADTWTDVNNQFYKRVIALKKLNPMIKVLLAIGGWNDSAGKKYSTLVNSPLARKKFIVHCVDFLEQFGFDGLDFDWEYPVCWQSQCSNDRQRDKEGFAVFVTELRKAFTEKNLTLTAAVSASMNIVEQSYDVHVLAENLDFINLMAYDYHGDWNAVAKHPSPLWSTKFEVSDRYSNVNFSVNYWIEQGMPSDKIVLGIPFYGRALKLASSANVVSPNFGHEESILGVGTAGNFTREAGILSYYEICDRVKHGYQKHRIHETGPFIQNGFEWIGFDDIKYISEKTKFLKKNKLGGAMIWSLDLDDFRGKCCGVRYPLLKAVNDGLKSIHSLSSTKCP